MLEHCDNNNIKDHDKDNIKTSKAPVSVRQVVWELVMTFLYGYHAMNN